VATWAGIQGDYYRQQHIFWFGPLFGAALAVLFYEYLGLKPENFEGAKDMDTAIFQVRYMLYFILSSSSLIYILL
jgi:hypothetical protein